MKRIIRKGISILIVVAFLISFLPALNKDVHAAVLIKEVWITSAQTSVQAGLFPEYDAVVTSANCKVDKSDLSWAKYDTSKKHWYGFGHDTPMAINDGSTEYALVIYVKSDPGYSINYKTKIYFNGNLVTEDKHPYVSSFSNGARIYINVGKATGTNPTIHTIHYHTNCEATIEDQKIMDGQAAMEPQSPYKKDYLFEGWYTDPSFSNKYKFSNPVTKDMDLYAKWTLKGAVETVNINCPITYAEEGVLVDFAGTSTTSEVASVSTTSWMYRKNNTWFGFAGEQPTAVRDGKTKYGMSFQVYLKNGNTFTENTKIIFNGKDVTNSGDTELSITSWGGYVHIDVGLAKQKSAYTVTFEPTTGQVSPTSQKTNSNYKLDSLPTPTLYSYDFTGWYTSWFGGTKVTEDYVYDKDTTIYAHWKKITHKVAFDSLGGNYTPSTQTVDYAGKAVEPTCPTKAGFDFVGWYTTENGSVKWDFNSTVYKDMTLYARWRPVLVNMTLTFDTNGGTPISSQTIVEGKKPTKPADPTKDGYTFGGWYKNARCTNAFDFNEPLDMSRTIYARWIDESATKYRVSFYDGSTEYTQYQQHVKNGDYAEEPPIPTKPESEHKYFKGWTTALNSGPLFDFENTPITGTTKLYASWGSMCKVSFDLDGGTAIYDVFEEDYVKPGFDITINSDLYYAFKEGVTPPNDSVMFDCFLIGGKEYRIGDTYTVNSTTTIRCKWTAKKTYVVTYDSKGGDDVDSKTVVEGVRATKPADPVKSGYTFDGWYTDESCMIPYDFDKPIYSNTTLYAGWLKNCKITIDYNGGLDYGYSSLSTTFANKEFPIGDFVHISLGDIVDFRDYVLAPTDKYFAGIEVNGEKHGSGFGFNIYSDTVIKVLWKYNQNIEYTLTFDSKGGSGVPSQTLEPESLPTEPEDPTLAGKDFDGWYIDDAYSALYDFSTPMTSDLTVYAKWKDKQQNADGSGGSGAKNNSSGSGSNSSSGGSSSGGSNTTTVKYSNEWVKGKWYNKDGTQTYAGTGSWKSNGKGWWFEDTAGWYPHSQWQKIDGKWYYFTSDGYMDWGEYRDGCWLNNDGSWDENYSNGTWHVDGTGWWFSDGNWYASNTSLWIDGVKYHFNGSGYWDY